MIKGGSERLERKMFSNSDIFIVVRSPWDEGVISLSKRFRCRRKRLQA
jgi:hypothetical protein